MMGADIFIASPSFKGVALATWLHLKTEIGFIGKENVAV